MDGLCVSLFGEVTVSYGRWQDAEKLTRTPSLLLAYLMLERHRFHARDVLAELFWHEHNQKSARNCLNTALWRLRRVLEPGDLPQGTYLVTSPSGDIGINAESDYWLDVAIFELHLNLIRKKAVEEAQPADIERIEAGVQLYTADLLEGVYEDWTLRAREHERLLYLNGLSYLLKYYHQQRNLPKCLEYGYKILALDPLREEIHRELIRIHLESGNRHQAVKQFEECREYLHKELGIAPMQETQALYDRIVAQNGGQKSNNGQPPGDLKHAIRQLNQARRNLDQAMNEYKQAVQNVERCTQENGFKQH